MREVEEGEAANTDETVKTPDDEAWPDVLMIPVGQEHSINICSI